MAAACLRWEFQLVLRWPAILYDPVDSYIHTAGRGDHTSSKRLPVLGLMQQELKG